MYEFEVECDKEVKSLPIGPTETSQMWYAPNRLVYNCLGLFVWGHGQPRGGTRHLVLRHVMEKPVELAIEIVFQYLPDWLQP